MLAALGPISGRKSGASKSRGRQPIKPRPGISNRPSRPSRPSPRGSHDLIMSERQHISHSPPVKVKSTTHKVPSTPPSGKHSGGRSSSTPKVPAGHVSAGTQRPSTTVKPRHTTPPTRNDIKKQEISINKNTKHITINRIYNYAPPKEISYAERPGQRPVSYPVYHETPPTYVYQYKESGSKYGTLLAGLALLNLGAQAAAATRTISAASQKPAKDSRDSIERASSNYKPQAGEYCKFGVRKDNGDYDETKIDCLLITSFILESQKPTAPAGGTNTTVVTISTNVTVVNITNGVVEKTTTPEPLVLYQMLANGTLVPVNVTLPEAENTTAVNTTDASNGSVASSVIVTTTTTNTTVTNAVDVKEKEIQVTPGMKCFVMRHTPTSYMKKPVPCDLLQSYADQSLKKNSAAK
ncbi:uncharacterized protein LOC135072275 isoform X1 [Ostrinia nubilalis]|uniref:uncharacterized protein LOC135072275 isoform X1 n=2 Tax=Ostrinia nubilalis TaxID=29057 RepID=UPI0030823AD7